MILHNHLTRMLFFVAHPMPFLHNLCRLYISLSLLCKPFMSLKEHRGIWKGTYPMLELISYYRRPGPFIKIIITWIALTMPRSWLMVLIPGQICCESICIEKSGQWLNLNVSKPVCFGHWVMQLTLFLRAGGVPREKAWLAKRGLMTKTNIIVYVACGHGHTISGLNYLKLHARNTMSSLASVLFFSMAISDALSCFSIWVICWVLLQSQYYNCCCVFKPILLFLSRLAVCPTLTDWGGCSLHARGDKKDYMHKRVFHSVFLPPRISKSVRLFIFSPSALSVIVWGCCGCQHTMNRFVSPSEAAKSP